MKFKKLTCSGRIKRTPFSSYVEAVSVSSSCSFSGPPFRACGQKWIVKDNQNCVEAVASAVWSPASSKSIGFVLVDSSHWTIGAEVEIDMLGDRRIGKITGLPFNVPAHLT